MSNYLKSVLYFAAMGIAFGFIKCVYLDLIKYFHKKKL